MSDWKFKIYRKCLDGARGNGIGSGLLISCIRNLVTPLGSVTMKEKNGIVTKKDPI